MAPANLNVWPGSSGTSNTSDQRLAFCLGPCVGSVLFCFILSTNKSYIADRRSPRASFINILSHQRDYFFLILQNNIALNSFSIKFYKEAFVRVFIIHLFIDHLVDSTLNYSMFNRLQTLS